MCVDADAALREKNDARVVQREFRCSTEPSDRLYPEQPAAERRAGEICPLRGLRCQRVRRPTELEYLRDEFVDVLDTGMKLFVFILQMLVSLQQGDGVRRNCPMG